MKAGTAARLVNLAVAVAIALVLLVPAAQSLLENDMQLPEMGTQAIYDLDLMDGDTLERNLDTAISGRTGCTVEYGDVKETIAEDGTKALAERIVASGADTATVRDSEGNIVVQQTIQYRNDLVVGVGTGVQFPGLASTVTQMDMRAHFVSADGKVDMVTNGYGNPNPGEISVICVIPLIVYNVAAGYGCSMGEVISIGYEGMATIDIDMGQKNVLSEGSSYSVSVVDGRTILSVTECPTIWSGTATIGDVEASCQSKTMTMSCEGKLSDKLTAGTEDGCLTISLNGDGYTMDERMTSSFISAIAAMEATA